METNLFIGGKYVTPSGGARFVDIEPATERELAQVADAGPEDIERAVAAAREAADHGPWPRMSAEARGRIMSRMADGIEKRARELGRLEARDVGKPVSECVSHDIARAARNLRFFANAAEAWTQEASYGDAKFLGADLKLVSLSERAPLGVGAIIIPWNSPLMLGTWNLGPCLAAGNTCIYKPSELAPLTAIALGEIAVEAGLPPGVLNILPGQGAAGAALVSHPDVDGIAFTGGVATGRRVMAAAAESLKRVTLELGGKSPNLVFADADLKRSAAGVARSIFRSQGQSCVAGSRLLVERKIADEFIAMVLDDMRKLKIGDPLKDDTEYGPLISAAHRSRVDSFVKEAVADGAALLAGGEISEHPRPGYYYLPTVLDRLQPGAHAVCEEIFGPVLTVERFEDEEQAVTMANATRYGLAAYIWTRELERALRVAARIKAGMVWVNSFFLRDLRTPFGGSRQSGVGRQGGRWSLEFWTEPKLVCLTYPEQQGQG
ncbi:MAG TPA: aldehyde dehydrogenase [Candidatus Binataceae bacterium]|jgi:aminomuconate-semialdehyde/2-hydroxymuconate-6-semialdehyde dehydrogenase|nr:aldehyde dehydrogenase [Candidatus Binataceae bacterium]